MKDKINQPNNHLIDVRTKEEVQEISVPGARNIPLDTLTQHVSEIKEMSKTGDVIVFCRSGARSGTAMDFLKQSGIENVYNAGGFADVLQMQD